MIDKNTYYEVAFVDMTHDAMGVCKIDGYPVFVKDALKGEKALIKVVKTNRSFGFGRLIDIHELSPFRKQPICEHYSLCGGCNTMHMNYQMQLDFKKHRVRETLRKLGRVDTVVKNTVGMNNPYYYRNKVTFAFDIRDEKIIAGFHQHRSQDIIDIKRCHIVPKVFSDMIKTMKAILTEQNISVYDSETKQGYIRAVMFRYAHTSEEIAVTLITKSGRFPKKEILIKKMRDQYPNINSIVQNIQPDPDPIILNSKSKVLFGKDLIEDRLLGVDYQISHQSFYQTNPLQTIPLYETAMRYASLKPSDVVLDAYSGIGTLALTAARSVKEVIGIETVKDAVKNAQNNAKFNEIDNVKFIAGDVLEVIQKLKGHAIDVLFVNPPRKGCEKEFLKAVSKLNIQRIIYISCNVSTLARDLNFLQSKGYKIQEVTPFDMFPQTSHIESVTRIEKNKS